MKVYALYYKDTFVVAFDSREGCVEFGKKYYAGSEWECNIIEKFLANSPQYPLTTLTPQQTIPCKVGDVPYPFTIDYSQSPKTNDQEIWD
jgi:hypothetical protein